MSIDGVKVLTIGKPWKLPHEVKHIESTSHIEETLANFRPDVIVTSTWIPGVLSTASFEVRKRWIHVPPEASDEAVANAVDNCYRNNLWAESPYAKDHPLISIFTPTYNTGDYLRTAFQSLRDQTYPTWEWVVVDDCSSDTTWDRLQEYAKEDFRVRPFRSGFRMSKIGMSKGMATRLCRGKILVELDHDDYLHEIALMEIKKAFDARPDVGFIYSNHASFYENGSAQRFDASPWNVPGRYVEVEYKGKKFLETRGPDIYDRFSPDFRHQFGWFLTVGPHHVKAFRADEFWRLGGYNYGMPVTDDWDIMARFFLRSKCLHLDKLLYFYRYRDAFGNATFTRNKSIQDHLALGRDNYGKEFEEFNARRLAEGEKNGKGPWHDSIQEITERASVPSQKPEEQPQAALAPAPGVQSPPWKSKVSFIILDATGSENTIECVQSIKKYANVEYEIVLVGNGVKSRKEAVDAVDVYAEVEANLGFSGGCNFGVSRASGNYLCFINDDVVLVDDTTIPKLLDKAKEGFVAAPYSNKAKPPQGNHEKALPVDMYPPMVVGMVMMVSAGMFRYVGGYETRLLTWEDDDLCLKLAKAGAKPVIVANTWVNHKGHKTFEALGLDHIRVERENQLKYQSLHPRIKVIAIAKNEASCLVDFYKQFEPITKEWYMLDTGSTDNTVELAKSIGVNTVSEKFTDFADMRNRAMTLFDPTVGSWVIMLDPDERLDPETIRAIPDLLWSQGNVFKTFHSRLIAVYPNGGQREFVAKPFIFHNDGKGKWMFKVHEKWITPEPYALVTSAINSHMLEFHDKKKREQAEDFYANLMAAEPYFADPAYKAKMREEYPILDYDRMDDPRITKITAGPLVSVIVPTFKRTELLAKAVQSALDQSWKTLEVVVVGDNCPDLERTIQAMKSWTEGTSGRMPPGWAQSHRVRVINLKQNYGAGGAVPRNVGIKLAASDWIAYLDDDNDWNPDHVERLFSTIIKEHTIWGWSSMLVNGIDMKLDRLENSRIDTSCVIHHRSLIAKYGPWKDRVEAGYCHDFELFSRWREEPQTVTKYPSVNFNAQTSGQQEFLERIARARLGEKGYVPPAPEVQPPKLSIMIASIDSRAEMLATLVNHLRGQCQKLAGWDEKAPLVEIVTLSDDGTTMTVGGKRNRLLEMTKGEYVAFIDDDDWVSDTYVEDMLRAITKSPDCVTFKGIVTTDGANPQEFNFDMNYPHNTWAQDSNGVHMRCPSCWCAFKASIAKPIKFMDIDCAEDRVWAIMLYPLLQTQEHIDRHMYFYKSSSSGTVAQQADKVAKSKAVIDKFRFTPYIRKQ